MSLQTALKRIREAQKSNASALDLSRLDLQEIPLDIAKLVRLKTLDLSQNYLTKIANLEHLTNLVGLDLSTNKLTEIKGLERLIQLTNLNLRYNQILSVKGLDYLTKLTELDLTRNQITSITGLQHLTNLSTLYLHNNLLTSINGLEHLTKLISLDLAFNQLTEIKRLETLTNLKRLDLRKNQLSELPEFLLRLELPICSYNHRFENYIDVWHNPFTNPHFEIVKEGNKAIKDYFERRKKNNIPLLNETRLVSQNVNQVPNTKPIPFTLKAFVSYSKFDGESATDGINYLEEFKQTLAPLSGRFNNLIETWDDTFLIAGEEWGNTIKSQLNSCDIIFLLISRHFLNTRYIIDVELANAVLRHKKKECIIVPIILKACGWTDIPILKDFNGIPRKGNNISAWKKNVDWTSRDDAWHHVYGEVKKLLEDFKSKK